MRKLCPIVLVVLIALLITTDAATYRDAPSTFVPDFKQTDSRWAQTMYSNHGDKAQTIKRGGCGICAAANVIAYLCDSSVTPVTMAKLSVNLGTCSDGGGTYPRFYTLLPYYYPVSVSVTCDLAQATACIDQGGLVIMSSERHARVIYAHTGDDYWLHDSGWGDDLMSQIMGHTTRAKLLTKNAQYYCYYRSEGG